MGLKRFKWPFSLFVSWRKRMLTIINFYYFPKLANYLEIIA